MACPYFFPTEPSAEILAPQRARLPLGDAYCGSCSITHSEPALVTLGEHCNLGYATGCRHLPPDRPADAVRFHLRDEAGQLLITCILERDHRPAGTTELRLNLIANIWTHSHPDPAIQRQAEICAAKYLARTGRPLVHAAAQG